MAKSANYSAEAEATLRVGYDPKADQATRDAQVAKLAADLGKSAQSVRMKLKTMGLYVAKVYRTKSGDTPATKDEIVTKIAKALNVTVDKLPGLEQAGKPALKRLLAAVDADEADEADEAEALNWETVEA